MRLVLDAGALIAIDRGDRRVAGLIELGRRAGGDLVTTARAVAQAWRNGARQVSLARALHMIDTRAVGVDDAKQAGELLAATGTIDVVDAFVALLANPADQILTSDATDLGTLLSTRRLPVTIVAV